MKDLKLTLDNHELQVTNYDLSLVSDLERVAQNIKIRLLFLFGEWFLDTDFGVKYIEEIMVKTPSLPQIDTIIKATIIETTDVIDIIEYQSEFDNVLRKMSITFKATTSFGELEQTTEI